MEVSSSADAAIEPHEKSALTMISLTTAFPNRSRLSFALSCVQHASIGGPDHVVQRTPEFQTTRTEFLEIVMSPRATHRRIHSKNRGSGLWRIALSHQPDVCYGRFEDRMAQPLPSKDKPFIVRNLLKEGVSYRSLPYLIMCT
jgi:hypothetical protein